MKHIYLNGVVVDNMAQLWELGMDDFSCIILEDVQRNFSELEPVEKDVMIHLNSRGGSVDAGNKIYDFLKTQEIENGINLFTRVDGECSSIASKIFLVAKKENRSITSHASVMIHLPMSSNGGNSEELLQMAQELEALNNEFAKFYSERTGMDEATALQYMKDETTFDADKCVELGIAGKKIETIKAFAFGHINQNVKIKNQKMESKITELINLTKSIGEKLFPKKTVLNAKLTGVDGTVIEFEGDEIAIGMTVTVMQNDAAVEMFTGEVTIEDGRTVVIAENVVTDIKDAEAIEDVEALKAENEALKAENAELKTATANATALLKDVEKGIGKTINVKVQAQTFAKNKTTEPENRIKGFKQNMKGQ